MSSMSTGLKGDFLNALLQGTSPAWLGDTNLYLSLHTADPGVGGNQTTNEVSYTGYARVAVIRTSAGWTISGGVGQNAATVNFPACTGGSATGTYLAIGRSSSGTGTLLARIPLGSSITIVSGITPSFPAGSITLTAS